MYIFTHVYPVDRRSELIDHDGVVPPPGALYDIPFSFMHTQRDDEFRLKSISFGNKLNLYVFTSPVAVKLSTNSTVVDALDEHGEQVVLFIQHEDYR